MMTQKTKLLHSMTNYIPSGAVGCWHVKRLPCARERSISTAYCRRYAPTSSSTWHEPKSASYCWQGLEQHMLDWCAIWYVSWIVEAWQRSSPFKPAKISSGEYHG